MRYIHPMTSCAIIPGGDDPGNSVIAHAKDADLVIAADSGLDHARHHGVTPHILVGDLDSVTSSTLSAFDGEIESHSPDKDKTDLELALDLARERDATSIEILGGGGGRLDHLLANGVVIASRNLRDRQIRWRLTDALVTVVPDRRRLQPADGTTLTLLAADGDATEVSVTGVRWPLHRVTLQFGSTWGVSNEVTEDHPEVTVGSGVVLAIQTSGDQ